MVIRILKRVTSKDDYIHKLMFNEQGEIVKDDAEQAFPPDAHEQAGYENIPD